MIKHLVTKLSIGRNPVNFNNTKLTQKINDHQSRIELDVDAVEQTGSHSMDKSKDWVGKPRHYLWRHQIPVRQ